MGAYLVKDGDGNVVGYLTSSAIADRIDGIEVHVGTYDSFEVAVEEVPNDDLF